VAAIWDDVAAMANAVKAGDAETGIAAVETIEKLRGVPPAAPDTIELAQIAQMTVVRDEPDETLHRLVMDLHKALNRLSAQHAEEVVDGAPTYGLRPEDRPAVIAFMRSVESTRKQSSCSIARSSRVAAALPRLHLLKRRQSTPLSMHFESDLS
jgi:ethanolamine ammonia-lyase large subunit